MDSDYFVDRKEKLTRAFEKSLYALEAGIRQAYGGELFDQIKREALATFEGLIPRIPYFGGGSTNPFNMLVTVAARMIAVHKPMKKHGKTAPLYPPAHLYKTSGNHPV